MKIIRLEIHNIASIVDTAIDFTTYPLADESIFLITGNTGSGKTTVLNAICMALYDRVPALYGASSDKDAEGMSVSSPMQLARRDAADCASVMLTYEGKDRVRYQAGWTLSRVSRGARKGEFKDRPERTLTRLDADGRTEYTYTSVREIDAMVLKTVDLTFDQFCRTTLLAQGQFLKFLESSEREKCEILEKLTGTEVYKRIGEEVNALYRGSQTKYDELNRQIGDVRKQLLSDDDLAKKSEEVAALALQADASKCKADEARQQLAWLENGAALDKALAQAQERLAKAQSADVSAECAMLKAWDATIEIREIMSQRKQLLDELNRIDQQETELMSKAASVRAGATALGQALERERQKAAEAEASLAKHAPGMAMYDSLGQIRVLAADIEADMKAEADNRKKAFDLERSLTAADKEMSQAQTQVADAKRDYEAASKAHSELEKQKNAYDIVELRRRMADLSARKEALAELKRAVDIHSEKSSALADAQSVLAEKEKQLAEAEALLPQLQKESEKAQAESKTMADKLQGQMDLADKLEQLKSIFHDEKRCPLCGSTDGHIAAASVISHAIEEAKAKADEADAKWQSSLTALNECKADIKSLKKYVDARRKDVEKCTLQAREAALALATAKQKAVAPEDDELSAWIVSKQSEMVSQIEKCDKELAEAASAIDKCAASQARLDGLRKKSDKAGEQLQKLQLDLQRRKADIDRLGAMADERHAQALSRVTQLAVLVPESDPLSAMLVGPDLPTGLKEQVERIEKAKKECESLRDTKTAAEEQAKILGEKIATIEGAFASMPRLADATAEGECRGDALEMCRALETSYHKLDALRSENQAKTAMAESRQEGYFASHSREETMAMLGSLPGTPSEKDAALWRKTVNDHDSELRTAGEFVESARKSIAEHQSSRPEALPEDAEAGEVKAAIDALEKERLQAIEQRTRIDADMKRDAELRAGVEQDLPRLQALEADFEEWREIDAMFGATKARNEFGVIAQRFIFNQLLDRANEYLRQLNPRYSLKCRLDSMQIYVVDRYMGDAERVANGLSGGEGFIASLSLALALSSINSDRESPDTIFIDEGFGTLSSDLLQTVIDMLDRLQCGLGRRVGIISHIDFLKERIRTKICLDPIPGKSASTVRIESQ